MSINRTKLWLGLALQLLVATVASAQELKENEWLPYFKDVQIGAPADLSRYGSGPKRKRGWFATAEALAWSISPPDRTTVGKEGYSPLVGQGGVLGFPVNPALSGTTGTTTTTTNQSPGFLTLNFFNQANTLDTGFIQPRLGPGQRYQIGYINEDGEGWMVGTIVLQSQTSQQVVGTGQMAVFAPFTNGINPLEGFIPGPNGVAFDVNGNHIFGPNGQDPGTLNPNPPPTFIPPFTGIPKISAPTDFGDLVQFPVIFHSLTAQQSSRLWGIEVMHLWQLPLRRNNNRRLGTWEALAGVRYLRFRDSFLVEGFPDISQQANSGAGGGGGGGATTNTQISNGVLGTTQIYQSADNNLIGPQLGLRWAAGKGRLSFQTEARVMGAANFQALRQTGFYGKQPGFAQQATLGQSPTSTGGGGGATGSQTPTLQPGYPIGLVPQSFSHTHFATQFAPVGEMRLNLNYQVYRSVAVQFGWTGLFMGGMARSANAIDYTLPQFGIMNAQTRQFVLVQGINVGVVINR
ncbi:MAG TPA: BBP7 family outer membrane beta-barrel protein [Pirellulales bacterium]|nr:BBP7 family outer membrane beta-barrel protein [Pirellulales bacterium]